MVNTFDKYLESQTNVASILSWGTKQNSPPAKKQPRHETRKIVASKEEKNKSPWLEKHQLIHTEKYFFSNFFNLSK